MRIRGLAALATLAACGGTTVPSPPPSTSAPTTCKPRWLTLEDDVIDLDVGADRVVWIEFEHGRIVAMPRSGEPRTVLRPSTTKFDYAHEMAFSGDRVVWADAAGGIWTLGKDGARVSVGTVNKPAVIEATRDLVVVAGDEGVVGLTFNGDVQKLHPMYAWAMAIDDKAAYVQANTVSGKPNAAILRLPFDGTESTMLAPEELSVNSLLVHQGRVLYTTQHGVFEAVGGKIKSLVEFEGMDWTGNLRAVGDRVYFTRDNVIYQLRDAQAVPIGIASEMIGDLEIDGRTFYIVTREYKGVQALCIDADAPPVAIVKPDPAKRACLPGEKARLTQYLATECLDAKGDVKYSIGFHQSGTVTEEYGRDGIVRTWYADGTLRDERPRRGAGTEKRYYVNGQLREEGTLDAEGEHHGTWKELGSDGVERAKTEWVHGKRK